MPVHGIGATGLRRLCPWGSPHTPHPSFPLRFAASWRAHTLCPSGRPEHMGAGTGRGEAPSSAGFPQPQAGVPRPRVTDQPSLSHRLQTDQEPGPLPQASWAVDNYFGPHGGTEDSLSCMGKWSRGWTRSRAGAATAHLMTRSTCHDGISCELLFELWPFLVQPRAGPTGTGSTSRSG